MSTVSMDNENGKYIEENENKLSALHVLLIIILLTTDYLSMLLYGIELKSFKYLVNYPELLLINSSIIIIVSLLAVITRKIPYLFFLNIVILLTIIIFELDEFKGFWDSLGESLGTAVLYAFVISIILYGPTKLYFSTINLIDSFGKWVIVVVFVIVSSLSAFTIYNHYISMNYNWNNINVYNDKYYFEKYDTWQTIFNQKIFSTNRLEKLQNDVNLKHSDYYINILKQAGILTTNILEYNNKLLFSNYIINGDYKTFIIVKKGYELIKKNKTTTLYMVFTKKDKFKEEYQVLDVLEKKIIVQQIKDFAS